MSDCRLPCMPNLGLLLELPIELSVQLGRAEMTLGDLLRLGPGSVIELSSEVGDPLDVFVNGKKIGAGEAVVIRRRLGLRLLSLLGPADRIHPVRYSS